MTRPERTDKMDEMGKTWKSHAHYLNRAFGDPSVILEKARNSEVIRDCDTLVGTGLSGSLVVPTLARSLGKYWAIVRKADSSHSDNRVEGEIGQKWAFVDDFVSSGATRERVMDAISKLRHGWDDPHPILTEYVGTFSYGC